MSSKAATATRKQSKAKARSGGGGGAPLPRTDAAEEPSHIRDSRFAKFESDPRFRLPTKQKTITKVDRRFEQALKDEDYTGTTQIDRYGRKIKSDKKKRALERLYEVEDDEDAEDDEDDDRSVRKGKDKAKGSMLAKAKSRTYDAARGGGFSASESDSDDNDEDSDDNDESSDDDSQDAEVDGNDDVAAVDMQQFRTEEAEVPTGEVTRRLAIVNLDWDHVKARDLMALFSSFVPKESSGRIERIAVYPSEFGKERMQREELEGPPREIFSKAAKDEDEAEEDDEDEEDDEGDDDEDEDNEDDDDEDDEDEKVKQDLMREENDEDFDSNALRSYQLDRLRYYYAVMECSDAATAEAVYQATDGREYQASSNFIDLRFVPDDVSFADDEPRDVCDRVPEHYQPVEFVTQALQHSKVKLTWDIHPEDTARKDLMRKAFSGTPAELIENDLRAYLASDSSDSDGDDDDGDDNGDGEGGDEKAGAEAAGKDQDGAAPTQKPVAKLSKKELARQKMRAALGLPTDDASAADAGKDKGKSKGRDKGVVGDMQITFMPALSGQGGGGAGPAGGADGEETTIEKYQRKERERKAKRKERALAKREGRDPEAVGGEGEGAEGATAGDDGVDLGFDDPFFADAPDTAEAAAALDGAAPKSKSAQRKEERLRKRAAREAAEKEAEEMRAEIEATVSRADREREAERFDLRAEMQAEKARKKEERKKSRKGGRKRAHDDDDGDDDDDDGAALPSLRDVDAADPRLQAMLGSADFAILPSHADYVDVPGMDALLHEARRKRKALAAAAAAAAPAAKKAKKAKTKTAKTAAPALERDDELRQLVRSVKRKAAKTA